jgi:opacity protein-like surface antigen
MGKAHYDVYESECVNGQTVVVVVPAGQTPKDDGCKKRRIGGFIWWNDGHDHVTIDTGTNTVKNSHTSTGTSTGTDVINPFKWEVGGGFNFYHESNEPFYGGWGSVAYHPKPCYAIVGDFTMDHHSETGFSSNMEWFMGGVRIEHQTPTFTPYGQVLLGGVHSSFTVEGSGGSGGSGSSGSANAFGMKLGGGLDWNVSPHFSVRLAEFNYDFTHFGGQTQNNFDYSAGVVWHFGQ